MNSLPLCHKKSQRFNVFDYTEFKMKAVEICFCFLFFNKIIIKLACSVLTRLFVYF